MSLIVAPLSEDHNLIAQVEQAVQAKTSGRIRGLQVHINDGCLVVTGRTSSYYNKQLATHAIHDTTQDMSVQNNVEVG